MKEAIILDALTEVIRITLENDSIILNRETTADDIEEWDSLNHTIVLNAIQKRFNLKFSLKEIYKFKNIGDICDIISNKLEQ